MMNSLSDCLSNLDSSKYEINDFNSILYSVVFEAINKQECNCGKEFYFSSLLSHITHGFDNKFLNQGIIFSSDESSTNSPIKDFISSEKTHNINKNKLRKYNILIAEDELINFEVLKVLLELTIGKDCNIIHAKNGKEAIDICKHMNDIDVVLMDIMMPKVTGIEATKQIKELHPNLPVVAQTAYYGDKERNDAKDAGCNDFITKPIEKDILKSVLSKYLK